jgi:hypothetical protein
MQISGELGLFVLLDIVLVGVLFCMLFCVRPMRFDFISEWIYQCQQDEHNQILPVLLVFDLAFIVVLQLDWMYRVSLHHLQHVAKLEVMGVWEAAALRRQAAAPDATRTRMVAQMLACKAEQHVVCVDGHSDAAFILSFSAIAGIAGLVHYNWKSQQHWLHYYGVFLFCCGFFGMLQIVWLNLQRVSTVASLRHLPRMSGMHWLVDSAIILFLLVFLMLSFVMGEKGPVVVASELLGFALLLFQFLYVFQTCSRSCEPLVVQRSAAWKTRVLVCLLLLLPFVNQFVK